MRIRMSVANARDPGDLVDIVVTAPVGAPLSAVAEELRKVAGADGPLSVGGIMLSEATALGLPPLIQGAVVAVGSPIRPAGPAGLLQLRVVAGPDAGAVHHLSSGRFRIGRGGRADVRLDDPALSRQHAEIDVGWDAATVRDLQSTNGTSVGGRPLGSQPVAVTVGAMIRLGGTMLALAVPDSVIAARRADGSGHLEVNRPPRMRVPTGTADLVLPAPPVIREPGAFPTVTMLVSLVLAAVVTLVWDPQFALFTLLTPAMTGGHWLADRIRDHNVRRRDRTSYDVALAEAEARISTTLDAEQSAARTRTPDLAQVLLTALGPSAGIWHRRPFDGDALLVRLGLGDLPAPIVVRDAAAASRAPVSRILHDVPVTVPMRTVGVLGLAGPRVGVLGLARAVLAQLAVQHSPCDLALVVLATPEHAADWSWAQWLPHLVSGPMRGAGRAMVGFDATQVDARVAELMTLLEARLELGDRPGHDVVVVFDGARALRSVPGVATLLQDGPAVGIHGICLDDPASLPVECNARALLDSEDGCTLRVEVDERAPVLGTADGASRAWAERLARALAPLRDAAPSGAAGALPDATRLTDAVGGLLAPVDIAAAWSAMPRSTTVVLGTAVDGPLRIDLTHDGPHALVAGTTGSGKSELLQTIVSSLALVNRPDEMAFVLVDYKGGAAFADCARLPHTVGLVTDLDERLTRRALGSMTAELERRERTLGLAGVRDLRDYRRTAGEPALPRMVIVVDEFATLAEELPEFVRGLVAVAQRGRSLGLHLVLATQRPAGVVSADIRANANLRIALRVTDAADSIDVIGTKDAAQIGRSTPGRAFATRGVGGPVAFQTAWAGGPSPTAGDPVTVEVVDWRSLGDPVSPPTTPGGPTELAVLVDAVLEAADLVDLAPVASPWLPPLPSRVAAEDLPEPAAQYAGHPLVPYALADLPREQTRRTVSFDLASGSTLLAVGGPRSGRSTLVRTIAAGIADRTSCADVHVYGLDGGGGALLPIAGLPHCGAVIPIDAAERVDRLLTRLTTEVSRRRALLAHAGLADVTEQRKRAERGQRLPYLVLLLDGWERITADLDDIDGGLLTDTLCRLLREGPSAGLRGVVTADRSGLIGKLPSLASETLLLRLADPVDVTLVGLHPSQVPDPMPPGRAVSVAQGFEMQVALLCPDPAGVVQAEAFRVLVERTNVRDETVPAHRRPFQLPPLPDRVSYADAVGGGTARDPLWMLVGLGGDDCTTLGVDLATEGPAFVIGGAARTGRSNALVVAARSLLERGGSVVAVATARSPLRGLDGACGVVTDDADAVGFHRLVDGVAGPLVVMVDDAELLVDTPVGAAVGQFLAAARGRDRGLVIAGTTNELASGFRGFVVQARRSRTGLLLGPRAALDCDLLGTRLPRTLLAQGPPGRGVLVVRDSLVAVQIPAP